MDKNNLIYDTIPVEFDPFAGIEISPAVTVGAPQTVDGKPVFDLSPVEFDPFADPEISTATPVIAPKSDERKPVVKTSPVDFNPFAGPEISLIAPATEPQVEIWTSCLIGEAPASCAYNECASLQLTGVFNKDAMLRALQEIVNMHQALRMSFSADGKNICVFKELILKVDYQDLSPLSSELQQKFITDSNKNNVLTPFDLINGPLFKTSLFKLADQVHYLTFVAHHIICDGWSIGIMMQDLSKLYSACAKNQFIHLPAAPLFTSYATEQLALTESASYKETEQYWLDQFKG
ncbi:MAG: condensation domain-containing protein, partial [Sphingobacteriales bacterium]